MNNGIISILVFVSLGLSGYSVYKHHYPDVEKMAQWVMEGDNLIQKKFREEAKKLQAEIIKKRAAELNADKGSPFIGNAEGDVTLTYFFDYRCGYCRRVDGTLDALVKADPKVKIVYKEYPILREPFFAKLALAAQNQGRYVDVHRALMGHKGKFTKEEGLKIAESLKLDMEKLKKDIDSEAVAERLEKNIKLAQTLRVEGTPMFIIGSGVTIPGAVSLDEFKSVIQSERDKQNKKS